MKTVTRRIDFSDVDSVDDFHRKMKELFGFPAFYGANFNAFVDCLTSLRVPEDGMTSIHLQQDESLILEIHEMDRLPDDLIHDFLLSIKDVNERCGIFGEQPSILLCLL
ncbi:barstar family protein [Burkholderia oklahomensis]|uniref:barstar family protein n=1 Tax=Burkholderia oklahomensis TaxID=342113 RepID=UPI0009DAC7B0|nr:barstar family protein [Burkholderia oklahomensis]QPS41306.1 barstar family protein [Burkholderia oklahomensis]